MILKIFLNKDSLYTNYPRGRTKNRTNTLNLSTYTVLRLGGDKRDRTADLLNAIQALSQLSYTPTVVVSLYILP